MESNAMFGFIALILCIVGFVQFMNGKQVSGKTFGGVGAVLLLAAFAGQAGMFGSLSMGSDNTAVAPSVGANVTGGDVVGVEQSTANSNVPQKIVDALYVSTLTYGSNSYTTAAGYVEFYDEAADPTAPNTNYIDRITVASGVGNTTAKKLMTGVPYKVIFNGDTAYYDQWMNPVANYLSYLPYVETTSATLSSANIKFSNIVAVATIPDPLNEASTSGAVNGQTTAANGSAGTNEIAVAASGSPADDSVLLYDKSVGDGQFYIDIDLGAVGANTGLKNPVLCFTNDRTNPFEGNEFTSVELQYRSGTDFGLPQDVTNYVKNFAPLPIGEFVKGGKTGTYRLTFTGDESLMDAGGDIMYIQADDLGKYLGQDLRSGTKATASDAITMQVQA